MFSVFPWRFVTIHCLSYLNSSLHHSVQIQILIFSIFSFPLHQSSSKGMGFVSFSICVTCLVIYLIDCVFLLYIWYLNMGIWFLMDWVCIVCWLSLLCMYNVLIHTHAHTHTHTHTHTLIWFGPNSHEFRVLFQFSDLVPSYANKVCCLVWFFLHLCVTWCSMSMSHFKRAAV